MPPMLKTSPVSVMVTKAPGDAKQPVVVATDLIAAAATMAYSNAKASTSQIEEKNKAVTTPVSSKQAEYMDKILDATTGLFHAASPTERKYMVWKANAWAFYDWIMNGYPLRHRKFGDNAYGSKHSKDMRDKVHEWRKRFWPNDEELVKDIEGKDREIEDIDDYTLCSMLYVPEFPAGDRDLGVEHKFAHDMYTREDKPDETVVDSAYETLIRRAAELAAETKTTFDVLFKRFEREVADETLDFVFPKHKPVWLRYLVRSKQWAAVETWLLVNIPMCTWRAKDEAKDKRLRELQDTAKELERKHGRYDATVVQDAYRDVARHEMDEYQLQLKPSEGSIRSILDSKFLNELIGWDGRASHTPERFKCIVTLCTKFDFHAQARSLIDKHHDQVLQWFMRCPLDMIQRVLTEPGVLYKRRIFTGGAEDTKDTISALLGNSTVKTAGGVIQILQDLMAMTEPGYPRNAIKWLVRDYPLDAIVVAPHLSIECRRKLLGFLALCNLECARVGFEAPLHVLEWAQEHKVHVVGNNEGSGLHRLSHSGYSIEQIKQRLPIWDKCGIQAKDVNWTRMLEEALRSRDVDMISFLFDLAPALGIDLTRSSSDTPILDAKETKHGYSQKLPIKAVLGTLLRRPTMGNWGHRGDQSVAAKYAHIQTQKRAELDKYLETATEDEGIVKEEQVKAELANIALKMDREVTARDHDILMLVLRQALRNLEPIETTQTRSVIQKSFVTQDYGYYSDDDDDYTEAIAWQSVDKQQAENLRVPATWRFIETTESCGNCGSERHVGCSKAYDGDDDDDRTYDGYAAYKKRRTTYTFGVPTSPLEQINGLLMLWAHHGSPAQVEDLHLDPRVVRVYDAWWTHPRFVRPFSESNWTLEEPASAGDEKRVKDTEANKAFRSKFLDDLVTACGLDHTVATQTGKHAPARVTECKTGYTWIPKLPDNGPDAAEFLGNHHDQPDEDDDEEVDDDVYIVGDDATNASDSEAKGDSKRAGAGAGDSASTEISNYVRRLPTLSFDIETSFRDAHFPEPSADPIGLVYGQVMPKTEAQKLKNRRRRKQRAGKAKVGSS